MADVAQDASGPSTGTACLGAARFSKLRGRSMAHFLSRRVGALTMCTLSVCAS